MAGGFSVRKSYRKKAKQKKRNYGQRLFFRLWRNLSGDGFANTVNLGILCVGRTVITDQVLRFCRPVTVNSFFLNNTCMHAQTR
jgi:hypothetical protein